MLPNCTSTAAWLICALALAATSVSAQPADGRESPAGGTENGMIALDFPEDLRIEVLLDYIGERRGINFLYGEDIGSQTVTIKTPNRVPADSLMELLASVLQARGLVMTSTGVEGLMRIRTAQGKLTTNSEGPADAPEQADAGPPGSAVTRVFRLEHASAERVAEMLESFKSDTTADLTPVPRHDLLIATDYADNMDRLRSLVDLVDRPGRTVITRFIKLEHAEAESLAESVKELLEGRAAAEGGEGDARRGGAWTVLPETRTNQVAVVGTEDSVDKARELIESLDVPDDLETRLYEFDRASPERVNELVMALISETADERKYRATADGEADLLVAMTTPRIHQRIERLKEVLDKPVSESESPVRFYKLENAKAAEVLRTLENIEGDAGLRDVSVDGVSAERRRLAEGAEAGAANPNGQTGDANGGAEDAGPAPSGAAPDAVELRGARVMADPATNTIIVVAEPSMHAVYERLIERLDIRRPQVLVEATVVSIDTTEGFSLGVEIHSGEDVNGGEFLNFTQFGLTSRDETTGTLTLNPGTGFNGALLDADIAEAVIQALETDSRARVVSRPSVLINDNAEGTLKSKQEEPFESVNASDTVATTSFGGFEEAGTEIVVRPQISEGEHLKLEYEIELSSFTGQGSDGVPPARQTNSLESEATFPDGHTIVVGGLTRENFNERIDRVPFLGSVPIAEYLFSSRSEDTRKTTLFAFIRAVILREDKFEDLKMLSSDAIVRSELLEGYPSSEPVEIR